MEVWDDGGMEKIRTIIRQSIFEKGGIRRLISRRSDAPQEEPTTNVSTEQGEWAHRIRLLNEECEALREKMRFSA